MPSQDAEFSHQIRRDIQEKADAAARISGTEAGHSPAGRKAKMPTASLYLPTSSSLPNSATILRRSNPDRPDTHSALGTDNPRFLRAGQRQGTATVADWVAKTLRRGLRWWNCPRQAPEPVGAAVMRYGAAADEPFAQIKNPFGCKSEDGQRGPNANWVRGDPYGKENQNFVA